jgi:polysaccharide biosynthesis transport protein
MTQIPSSDYPQLPPPSGYASPSAQTQKEKEIHLRDYWKVIRKRRWTIIAFFLIVLVTTGVATFTMKPVYRATTTIKINKENPQIVDFKEIFSVNTTDMDYYQTEYKILESRTLAKRVIEALKLSQDPEFLPEPQTPFQKWKSDLWASVSSVFSSSNKDASSSQNEDPAESEKETLLINSYLRRLKIEPIRNSRLVKIHFDSKYPQLSAKVSNTLAAAYIRQGLESRVNTSEQAKEWLDGQLDMLKAKVEKADEALQAFGAKHDIVSLEEKENVTMQRLTELSEALTKAEAERMAKEGLHRQVKGRQSDSLPAILDNKLIQDLKQSYIQLEAQYMKLSETYKPDYPEMVRLKNQMEAIHRRIDVEVTKIIDGIRNEYESFLRREALLRQAFAEQKARAMDMKQNAIQYNILKREADTNKELHKGLLQRMKEVGVSAGITASNIIIVDQAEVPLQPYKPDKRLNLILAAVVGLFLGMGLAFFFEYLDNTVKTPQDLEQFIQLPSFGMVPEISYERRKRLESGNHSPVELITYSHPKSMLSESYRNIRTSILLSFSEKPPKRIVITSPNPSEGKTTTAVNTSIALSQTGAKVIIIDCDMRNPRVHRVFEEENGVGLSSFLSGNAPLDAVILKSEIPNFYYIPAGPIPPNPSELLSSNLFKEMMDNLSQTFDNIIVDSPPILGFADSIILSKCVDGVVLVVLAGKTPKETLSHAKELLHQVNAKILGVVINRVDIQRSDYGYYYYRYQYYYGAREGKKKKITYLSGKEPRSTSV